MKRKVSSDFLKMNEDKFDVDSLLSNWIDDAVWYSTSEISVGSTIKGKKAIADWFRRWIEEFPKRNFVVQNICFGAWPLSPSNVITVEWSSEATDKGGKKYRYDGCTVFHTENMKIIRASEYLSFNGLPQISELIKPVSET